jgi:hypothetical protein
VAPRVKCCILLHGVRAAVLLSNVFLSETGDATNEKTPASEREGGRRVQSRTNTASIIKPTCVVQRNDIHKQQQTTTDFKIDFFQTFLIFFGISK